MAEEVKAGMDAVRKAAEKNAQNRNRQTGTLPNMGNRNRQTGTLPNMGNRNRQTGTLPNAENKSRQTGTLPNEGGGAAIVRQAHCQMEFGGRCLKTACARKEMLLEMNMSIQFQEEQS